MLSGDGRIAWFAHDLFARYRHYGQPLYRDFFAAALKRLMPAGYPVEVDLPSGGRATLFEQPRRERYVLHLLFAVPAVRGGEPAASRPPLEIIEELIPLHHIACVVRIPHRVKTVRLVPDGLAVPFTQDEAGGAVRFSVPRLEGHQMVELACPGRSRAP